MHKIVIWLMALLLIIAYIRNANNVNDPNATSTHGVHAITRARRHFSINCGAMLHYVPADQPCCASSYSSDICTILGSFLQAPERFKRGTLQRTVARASVVLM